MEQQLRRRDFPLKPWESCLTGELANKQTHTPAEITLKLLTGELLVNGTQRHTFAKYANENKTSQYAHSEDNSTV